MYGYKLGYRASQGSLLNYIAPIPTGFVHPMGDLIVKVTGNSATIENKSINDYRKVIASPVVKYLDAVNGSDANNGNTAGTAYKTLGKLSGLSYDRVIFASGNYAAAFSVFGLDREWIGAENTFVNYGTLAGTLAWSATDNYYSATFASAPSKIIFTGLLDSKKIPTLLILRASVEEVNANVNSYYYTGTTLYVNIGEQPSDSLHIVHGSGYFSVGAGLKIYLENINTSHIRAINATATPTYLLFKNVIQSHDYAQVGLLRSEGNVYSFLKNCKISKGKYDGYNYHGSGSYNPAAIEDGCEAFDFGLTNTSDINNASTGHEGTIILRLNGNYYNTKGPAVHDINQSKSLNIKCISGDSTSGVANNRSSFAVGAGAGETATMWLDNCDGGSATTFGAENRAVGTAHIYARKSRITNVEPGTTVESY